jgi:SdrD B-like domain
MRFFLNRPRRSHQLKNRTRADFRRSLAVESLEERLVLSTPTLALNLSEPGFAPLTIVDNGLGDTNPSQGILTFAGSYGDFSLQFSTGESKPFLGLAPTMAELDINNLSITSTGASGPLSVSLSDTDFMLNPGSTVVTSSIGGNATANGSVIFQSYVDTSNMLFGTSGLTVSTPGLQGPLQGSPFTGGATGSVLLTGTPFSITTVTTITLPTAGGRAGFDADLELDAPTVTQQSPPVTIGDYVWNDSNDNGVQDATEPGIPGVTLTLTGTDSGGNPVTDQTTTDNTGHYLFTEVPGTYTVTVDAGNFTGTGALVGYSASPTLQGTDTTIDSNPNPSGTTPGALPGGSSDLTLDFGYYKPVTIGDFVWNDNNANGIQDSGEAGINGVALTLMGTDGAGNSVTAHTTTSGNGGYLFTEAPGTYTVTVDASNFTVGGALAAYTASPTLQGGDAAKDSNVTPSGTNPSALPGGSNDLTIDFGYYQPVTIGDFVWNDTNANGVQDSGEAGINGVTLTLTGTNGAGMTVTDHATTSGNGAYLFTEAPGTYTVTIDASNSTGALAGYFASPTGKGTTATDSNVNPSGTTPGTLPGGSSDLTLDFGYYKKVTIGDFVWNDTNANGIQNGGESGINGVTLTLTGTNGAGQSVTDHATTSGNGAYLFTEAPGTYTVTVDNGNFTGSGALAAYTASPTIQGGNTALDSNLNPSGTTPTALPGGSSDLTLDFGYYKPTGISGKKFTDLSGNGFSSDDTPLAGVTINLYQGSSASGTLYKTAVTLSDGSYNFTNLSPGSYFVQEVVPAGWTQTGGIGGYSIVAQCGLPVGGKNFDDFQNMSVSGTKYLDVTGNGYTSDDTGLGGVTINLFKDTNGSGALTSADGGPVASTVSNSDPSKGPIGSYSFTNLAPGTYFVQEVMPSGFVSTGGPAAGYYTVADQSGNIVTGDNFVNAETCDLTKVTNVCFKVTGGGTTTTVSDLRGNTDQGDSVTVTFTYTGTEVNHPFTLVSYTAPGPAFDATTASQQAIYQQMTVYANHGGTYSITVGIPNCYYQVDFVCGFAIDHLGPANSNIFYSAQQRLVSADNGGTCANLPVTISGTKFLDATGNGMSSDDSPLTGSSVTIDVFRDADGSGSFNPNSDPIVAKVMTNSATGKYVVTGLVPGRYFLQEEVPTGYVSTGPASCSYIVVNAASGATYTGNNFDDYKLPSCNATNVCYTINGYSTVTSLTGNTHQGDHIDATFTIPAGATVSLVSYIAPSSSFNANTASQQVVYDSDTVTATTAGTYSLHIDLPEGYYQVDLVCGQLIDHFGAASSNIFYTSQNRLISADNGGNNVYGSSGLVHGDTATTTFWSSTSGQNLINALNGGSSSHKLADWLTSQFPNLFPQSLIGTTNASVANYYKTIKASSATQLETQVMALALSLYVTDSDLAGGTVAVSYGFNVSVGGTAAKTFNVGTNGSCLGLTNNAKVVIMVILDQADSLSNNGTLFKGNTTQRNSVLAIFNAINNV